MFHLPPKFHMDQSFDTSARRINPITSPQGGDFSVYIRSFVKDGFYIRDKTKTLEI